MKKFLLVANWKANLTLPKVKEFIAGISNENNLETANCEFVICPASCYLSLLDWRGLPLSLGAQNISKYDKGNYTGEVTAHDLASLNLRYCIVGHSERRKYFGEKISDCVTKVNWLLEKNIIPILCVSSLEDLFEFEKVLGSKEKIIFCYEPTDFISSSGEFKDIDVDLIAVKTGELRSLLGKNTKILYGGSVNVSNIRDIGNLSSVDGFLIGQSSLAYQDFLALAYELHA